MPNKALEGPPYPKGSAFSPTLCGLFVLSSTLAGRFVKEGKTPSCAVCQTIAKQLAKLKG